MKGLAPVLSLVCVYGVAVSGTRTQQQQRLAYRHVNKHDISGHDLSHVRSKASITCVTACDAMPECRAWTFANNNCWFKSSRDPALLVPARRTSRGSEAPIVGLASHNHPTKPLQAAERAKWRSVEPIELDETLGKVLQVGVVPDPDRSPHMAKELATMWYELTETVADCVDLCHQREVGTICLLFDLYSSNNPTKWAGATPARLRGCMVDFLCFRRCVVRRLCAALARVPPPMLCRGVFSFDVESSCVLDVACMHTRSQSCTAFVFVSPDFCHIATATEATMRTALRDNVPATWWVPGVAGVAHASTSAVGRHAHNTEKSTHFFPDWVVSPEDNEPVSAANIIETATIHQQPPYVHDVSC